MKTSIWRNPWKTLWRDHRHVWRMHTHVWRIQARLARSQARLTKRFEVMHTHVWGTIFIQWSLSVLWVLWHSMSLSEVLASYGIKWLIAICVMAWCWRLVIGTRRLFGFRDSFRWNSASVCILVIVVAICFALRTHEWTNERMNEWMKSEVGGWVQPGNRFVSFVRANN